MKVRCVLLSALLGISLGVTGCKGKGSQGKESTESIVEETKEYEIYNTMIFQNGETKEVYCNVIINAETYDLEDMFETVKKDYLSATGESDKITFRFYESVDSLKTGDCKSEKIYTK